MSKSCNNCKKPAPVIVQVSMERALCRICYHKELRSRRSLIKRLPKAGELCAPLGYNWIGHRYFSPALQDRAKSYCDVLFKSEVWGTAH
jgi:hypothetical protein